MCQMKWYRCPQTPSWRIVLIIGVALLFIGCTAAESYDEPVLRGSPVSSNESININTATKDELQRIPFVGERLAEEIIAYREKHGRFRRSEHLMLLRGISDRRYREIRHLVRVD